MTEGFDISNIYFNTIEDYIKNDNQKLILLENIIKVLNGDKSYDKKALLIEFGKTIKVEVDLWDGMNRFKADTIREFIRSDLSGDNFLNSLAVHDDKRNILSYESDEFKIISKTKKDIAYMLMKKIEKLSENFNEIKHGFDAFRFNENPAKKDFITTLYAYKTKLEIEIFKMCAYFLKNYKVYIDETFTEQIKSRIKHCINTYLDTFNEQDIHRGICAMLSTKYIRNALLEALRSKEFIEFVDEELRKNNCKKIFNKRLTTYTDIILCYMLLSKFQFPIIAEAINTKKFIMHMYQVIRKVIKVYNDDLITIEDTDYIDLYANMATVHKYISEKDEILTFYKIVEKIYNANSNMALYNDMHYGTFEGFFYNLIFQNVKDTKLINMVSIYHNFLFYIVSRNNRYWNYKDIYNRYGYLPKDRKNDRLNESVVYRSLSQMIKYFCNIEFYIPQKLNSDGQDIIYLECLEIMNKKKYVDMNKVEADLINIRDNILIDKEILELNDAFKNIHSIINNILSERNEELFYILGDNTRCNDKDNYLYYMLAKLIMHYLFKTYFKFENDYGYNYDIKRILAMIYNTIYGVNINNSIKDRIYKLSIYYEICNDISDAIEKRKEDIKRLKTLEDFEQYNDIRDITFTDLTKLDPLKLNIPFELSIFEIINKDRIRSRYIYNNRFISEIYAIYIKFCIETYKKEYGFKDMITDESGEHYDPNGTIKESFINAYREFIRNMYDNYENEYTNKEAKNPYEENTEKYDDWKFTYKSLIDMVKKRLIRDDDDSEYIFSIDTKINTLIFYTLYYIKWDSYIYEECIKKYILKYFKNFFFLNLFF